MRSIRLPPRVRLARGLGPAPQAVLVVLAALMPAIAILLSRDGLKKKWGRLL